MDTAEVTTGAVSRPLTWTGIWTRATVALLLFAACNVYTYETSGFYEREREYRAQLGELPQHHIVRVIFAGDSHIGVPLNQYLNSDLTGAGYSIAFAGDSPRECFAKVRRALELAPDIDTLVLSADPHMFGKGRLASSNRSFADWYFIVDRDRSGVEHNLWSALLQQVPLFSDDFLQYFRKDLAAMLAHSPRRVRADSDDILAWSRLTDEQRLQAALDTGRADHDGVGQYEAPFTWYRRILELARAHHVTVIGARFPVHPGYSSQEPAGVTAKIDEFLLANGMTQIIDLQNEMQEPKNFLDEDHVNDLGAVPLVQILEQRLQRRLR
jgi:hypothetical protein